MNSGDNSASPTPMRAPLREGLLTGSLRHLDTIRLAGCLCANCGEISLGERAICPNCGRDSVTTIPLGTIGTLWSFTVIRHRPPGDYRGPDPFVPFGLGLVELPEGLRVLTPLKCDVTALRIGLPLRFTPYLRHDPDREVVVFTFEPHVGATADV
jgi:uncharacterized protein